MSKLNQVDDWHIFVKFLYVKLLKKGHSDVEKSKLDFVVFFFLPLIDFNLLSLLFSFNPNTFYRKRQKH